jgi:hypothetical protein
MTNYAAELSPVHVPLPNGARMFVLFEAASDALAVETVQALGVLRHDKLFQVDLYRRPDIKIYSGLSRVKPSVPRLSVVA